MMALRMKNFILFIRYSNADLQSLPKATISTPLFFLTKVSTFNEYLFTSRMKSHTRQEGLLFHSLDLKISILVSLLIKLVQKKKKKKERNKRKSKKKRKNHESNKVTI